MKRILIFIIGIIFCCNVYADEVNSQVENKSVDSTTQSQNVERNEDVKINIKGYNLDFELNKYDYKLFIWFESKLDIMYNLDESKIKINGNENLKNGSIITITINGREKPYTIKITKGEDIIIYVLMVLSIILFINIFRLLKKYKSYN